MSGQDHSAAGSGLSNGTLESLDSGLNKRGVNVKIGSSGDTTDSSNGVDGNNLGGTATNNDVDDDGKVESAAKRMRGSNPNQVVVSSAGMTVAQNNAAYMAAAQSYHNALAAINYTGVALQTNKNAATNAGAGAAVPVSSAAHAYAGAGAQLQGHPGAAAATLQQQQSQQQQLLNQYQAMAAAALANPAFQNPALALQQMAAAAGNVAGNQTNMNNLNMNAAGAAAAGLNPFAAAAAMNPMLGFTQFAVGNRAMLASSQPGNHAGALQGANATAAQLNPNALAGMQGAATAGNPSANAAAAAAAFNPFGVQFGGHGAAATALPFQAQNQQALLAAYASGQLAAARGPVPNPGAAQAMTQQQLFNPAAAAAAAAAAAGNGGIPGQGVKRMRPA